jgi:malonate-semialdehyde dehydrogenase (acetylating) / methylmalonate-semialdehyde dehydrogenase
LLPAPAGGAAVPLPREIFGPVLEVMREATYVDAVKLVSENPYGNGTAIFTRDGSRQRPR